MKKKTRRRSARVAHDSYPTPAWCVRRLLERVHDLPLTGRCLEPCAGRGSIVRELLAFGPVRPDQITTVELQPELVAAQRELPEAASFAGIHTQDFRLFRDEPFDFIITNPPYKIAQEIVAHSLDLLAPLGRAAFLLRLNFLASEGRVDWLQKLRPDVHVLPNRPGFVAQFGRTDGAEYGWFVFGAGTTGRVTVLNPTPVMIRRLHHSRLWGAA